MRETSRGKKCPAGLKTCRALLDVNDLVDKPLEYNNLIIATQKISATLPNGRLCLSEDTEGVDLTDGGRSRPCPGGKIR